MDTNAMVNIENASVLQPKGEEGGELRYISSKEL